MLKLERVNQKKWLVKSDKKNYELNLVASTITNKFEIITSYIERIAKFNPDFEEWFVSFFDGLQDEDKRTEIVSLSVDKIKYFSDSYLNSLNIDYAKFVDKSKSKSGSILFTQDEIQKIIRLSGYLKIYSVVSNSDNLSVSRNVHRKIYNKFASDLVESQTMSKIFDIVKTKTFRYKLTDKFMWDYIKTVQCKDISTHVVEIFNFIMNNIIVLCEEDKNPISYFVGVVDESVKWFLRSVYKGTIVYEDEIATEDIHRTHINNLRSYSFNDTLGRLKTIAFDKIYEKLEHENVMSINDSTDQYIIDFNNRLSSIEYISPLCMSLVFPILSRITDISYIHFKTVSPEHSAVLSYYLNRLLEKVFKNEYKNLFTLLDYYPLSSPSIATTYKIKDVHSFLSVQNTTKNFFTFNTKIFLYNTLCQFVGNVSRIKFEHLLTGKKLMAVPLSKIEHEMIYFYSYLFSGQLDDKIDSLATLLNQDF